MDIHELEQQAFTVMQEEGPLAAANLFFRAHEELVASVKAARDAADASPGMKEAREAYELDEDAEPTAEDAMGVVRVAIFDAIQAVPDASILLYELLKDYAANEVKDYRDNLIRRQQHELGIAAAPVAVSEPEWSKDLLANLKKRALAFFTFAGEPVVNPTKEELSEDPHTFRTKTSKAGEIAPAFSRSPRESGESEATENDSRISTSRLRYAVDGTELPAGSSLTTVALWGGVSSYDWTVDAADIKAAFVEQVGEKWSETDDFTIEINGHVLRRWREQL